VAKPIGNHTPFVNIDLYVYAEFLQNFCPGGNGTGGFVSAANRAIASLHRLQGVEPEKCWGNSQKNGELMENCGTSYGIIVGQLWDNCGIIVE
jgi:hypothetical protein